jgi:GNAT superfamily N-acetyltransferase
MKLISNYRDQEILRNSFIQLSADIFGLNFKSWHKKGYWNDRYIPYSYADGDKIVANASVNQLDFVIEGKMYKAMQIGTVMTHPDYRKKGLAANLMNHIIEEYEGKYDFMYLFANDSVLDFYPKFGFRTTEETQYTLKDTFVRKQAPLRKLDISIPGDLELIDKIVYERVPVSNTFSTVNSGSITMYHILNVFTGDLYFLEEQDIIIIYSKTNGTIHLFDVISKASVDIEQILGAISDSEIEEFVFHFTPDQAGLEYERSLYQRDGALFVKSHAELPFPLKVKHPITSEA